MTDRISQAFTVFPITSASLLTPPSFPSHFQQACYYIGPARDHLYPCLGLECLLSPPCLKFYLSLPGPPWTHTYSRKPPRNLNICLLPWPYHLSSLLRCEARYPIEVIRGGAVALSSLLPPISTRHRTGYTAGTHSMWMECHLTQGNWSEKTNRFSLAEPWGSRVGWQVAVTGARAWMGFAVSIVRQSIQDRRVGEF